MAEAYGWGKFLGMTAPWIIDGASRVAGVEVDGVEGFYIPFFYAMADQIGASAAGFVFLRRRSESLSEAVRSYLGHPVMMSGVVVIMLVPGALLAARILGFSPSSQLLAAVETHIHIATDGQPCEATPGDLAPPAIEGGNIAIVVLFACTSPPRELTIRDEQGAVVFEGSTVCCVARQRR